MTPNDSAPKHSAPIRFSYLFMGATLILAGLLHLANPLIATLFGYLALNRLHFSKRGGKWTAVALFVVLMAAFAYGVGHFVNRAVRELPEIADKSIPLIIQWAKNYQIELPFTDYDSLKDLAFGTVKSEVTYLGRFANFAKGATRQFVFLAVGAIVAISLFLDPRMQLDRLSAPNLYSIYAECIAQRFRTFYRSFATVMGAQVLISALNTLFTGIFALVVQLPYGVIVIGITFLCGLLPVIGNLISNTIIVCIGFTVSPQMALTCLVFLVVIHKLEYFLNSKIVGHRIRNPLWLTLLALILGERLMGIPGIILAPVVLNYIKLEASEAQQT